MPAHIDYLRSCLQNEKPVNEAIHQRMQQLLLRYVVVGGMPEAVTTFFDSNNMNEVFEVQHGIIETYKADMLIRYKGECYPLECKSTTGNAKSLKTVLKHPEHYHIGHAIKIGEYNVGRSGQILTLPFYLSFLLTESLGFTPPLLKHY